MSRHPHDIVPRDDKDEVLLAIYDVLVEIRDALVPTPSAASEPVSPETPTGAGTADETPVPAPQASQKVPAKRKPAAKKPAARKKPA
jgi:hypothetical protein